MLFNNISSRTIEMPVNITFKDNTPETSIPFSLAHTPTFLKTVYNAATIAA